MGDVRAFSAHVFWMPEEIEVVTKHYPSTAWPDLLSLLPRRTKSQITNKANLMGLQRHKEPKMSDDERRRKKREHMARTRQNDPDAARAYGREHYSKNREAMKAYLRAMHERRFFWSRSMRNSGVTAKQLAKLWKNQRGKCALTGRRLGRSAQIDHILPKAKGGKNEIGNLRWVCEEANIAKRHMTDAQFFLLCEEILKWRSAAAE